MSQLPRDRIRGSLLGGAVGDALGAPIEFDSLREIRARFGAEGLLEPAPAYGRLGAITDDTQMTLFTAEGLILAARDPAFSGRSGMVRSVHRAYLRWLRTQGERSAHPTFERTDEGWLLGVEALHSRRGPGSTCLSALRAPRMGSAAQPLNSSKGCGGVMRIAPVGLAGAIGDPFAAGCEIAAITHGHPSGFLAAGFQALAIREAAAGTPLRTACQEALEELRRHPSHEECAAAVERAISLSAAEARRGYSGRRRVTRRGLGGRGGAGDRASSARWSRPTWRARSAWPSTTAATATAPAPSRATCSALPWARRRSRPAGSPCWSFARRSCDWRRSWRMPG